MFAQASKELDQHLCQALRLPGINDMDHLPYISTFVKEVLRWRPTVPISPPHEMTEDLQYAGYTFPKGTNFIINVIATSQKMSNHNDFDPER